MPKPKSLLKETSKAKKKAGRVQKEPDTADEYLAAGVDHEEAGEKWRAGDPVKSMRFFMRAIETYENGLGRFRESFDLAYNKARVQYEMTQHPKLAAQLPASLVEILQVALRSHRVALGLQQDNTDILFNTAQVLTSLAEAVTEGKRHSEQQQKQEEAMEWLREALELLQRCLTLQELRLTESEEQMEEMESGASEEPSGGDGAAMMGQETRQGSTDPEEQEQWAAVIEPITKSTLVDTAIAQLETLATLCGLLTFDHGSVVAWVEEYSSSLLKERIASYIEGTGRQHELLLAKAKFMSAMTDVSYRSGRIDLETYKRELGSAFEDGLDLSNDPDGLCSRAEALIAFNSSVSDSALLHQPDTLAQSTSLRWQALSSALDSLTAASKLPQAENLPKIHIARGDVEVYRWQLGRPPWNYAASSGNSATLLKNAQTYYRGAAALAQRDGAASVQTDASSKEAIALAIAGDGAKLDPLIANSKGSVVAVAEEMIEEGLVAAEDMESLFSPS
ncbi:hypothetical protein FQN54_008327 [Arachnomyces sp. PD_36]|nr:hypothetical protein FQN54_008327 [Arachnomyces sp. PD_36]